jgi:RNase P/RNase MRP subunit p29
MFAFEQTFYRFLAIVSERGSVVAYMSKTYSDWLGRQVVLQIEAGESLVPLRGLVVNESNNALRFRLGGGWEVDIYKDMILRVEADNCEAFQLCNWKASNKAPGAAPSESIPMLSWNRFDRWSSKHFSWLLWRKTIISTGLAGSFLFVLALRMDMEGPITHFALFICGYLGLVSCAVSLGCGVRVFIDLFRTQAHIFAKWSKVFASFLDWFRQPIHF